MPVKAVSVFSGGGLMDLGFDAEGIDIIEHCEWNKAAVATLRRNWPSDVKVCNADKYMPPKGLDLLFGGPPCQPYSKGGKQLGELDPRDRFNLAHTWAEKARPRLIVFETVANVFAKTFDEWRDEWWSIMDGHGYDGVMWHLNSADYGTPQLRERVFFVAWRKGEKKLAKVLDQPPPVTHTHPSLVEETGLPVWTTALERLTSGCCGRYGLYSCMGLNNAGAWCETCEAGGNYHMALNEEEPEQGGDGDGGPDLSDTQIKYLLRRPDRVTVKHVPTDMSGQQSPRPKRWLLAETVPKNLRKGVPYGLLIHQDAQYKSVRELLEDQLKVGGPGLRFMTVREAAKLQDCPQWYTFEGSWGQQRAQVGNAVPVNVARAVARQIMRAFGRRTPKLALVNSPQAGLWPIGGANVACRSPTENKRRSWGRRSARWNWAWSDDADDPRGSLTEKKQVELPAGCMITDRRTWERQQARLSRVEAENRQYAHRVQGLSVANEALRERVAEAEDLAVDAMADAEAQLQKAGRAGLASTLTVKAVRLSKRALDRVLEGSGRSSFGGALTEARDACRKALAAVTKVGD